MKMLIIYDIADPKRLRAIANIMEDYGVRVQKSIFELDVGQTVFQEIKIRVGKAIEEFEDGVKYFPLCERCTGSIEIIGKGVYIELDEEFFIL